MTRNSPCILVEQQNALQRFADEAGYKVVRWHVDGDGVEVPEPALSRLMADVVSEGRKLNAALVGYTDVAAIVRTKGDCFLADSLDKSLNVSGVAMVASSLMALNAYAVWLSE